MLFQRQCTPPANKYSVRGCKAKRRFCMLGRSSAHSHASSSLIRPLVSLTQNRATPSLHPRLPPSRRLFARYVVESAPAGRVCSHEGALHQITSHPSLHHLHPHFLNHKPFTGATELVTRGGLVYLRLLPFHLQPFLFHPTTSRLPNIHQQQEPHLSQALAPSPPLLQQPLPTSQLQATRSHTSTAGPVRPRIERGHLLKPC